jgi:hypothetical protein
MIDDEKCFAFIKGTYKHKCAILNVNSCKGCRFWKSIEQYETEFDEYPPDMSKFMDKKSVQAMQKAQRRKRA